MKLKTKGWQKTWTIIKAKQFTTKMLCDYDWKPVHQALNNLYQNAWTSLNDHVHACQQHCSSWPAQPCSSQSTTLFKLASSTMFKHVNNTVQPGQLNLVQTCQQHCSSWSAQPCSRLSAILFKLVSSTLFKSVNNTVQAGQLNHVQVCQQHCSSWPAEPCSNQSTCKTSCAFLPVFSKRNTSKISIIENTMLKHAYFIHIFIHF